MSNIKRDIIYSRSNDQPKLHVKPTLVELFTKTDEIFRCVPSSPHVTASAYRSVVRRWF